MKEPNACLKKNIQKITKIGTILLLIFCILATSNAILQSANHHITNMIHQWKQDTGKEWHNPDDGT